MANLMNEFGRPMSSAELRKAMGLSTTLHLPDTFGPVDVDGTSVYIVPKTPGQFRIRTIAVCSCGKHVPAGRLFQHRKFHKGG